MILWAVELTELSFLLHCLSSPLSCSTLCFLLWLPLIPSILHVCPVLPQSNALSCLQCVVLVWARGNRRWDRVVSGLQALTASRAWFFSIVEALIGFLPSSVQPPVVIKLTRMQHPRDRAHCQMWLKLSIYFKICCERLQGGQTVWLKYTTLTVLNMSTKVSVHVWRIFLLLK